MTATLLERKERKATASAVKARLTQTVGGMIDSLNDLREAKRKLETDIHDIEAKYAGIEEALTKAMADQGIEKASGAKATVSFSSNVVAVVEDWDQFLDYIYTNKFGHLVQRRVSDPAYRELREMGKVVPGATDFVKKRLNLRSV